MSDPGPGDGDGNFLARWSQRKRAALRQADRQVPAASAEAPAAGAEHEAAPEVDLSSLPKLDDLTDTTDITAFLRQGVPEALRNAALRKSWALDPAIRNYVSPALEYAYDWNSPGGVPGSSEIGAGMDVARLVSQIIGGDNPVPEPPSVADAAAGSPDDVAQSPGSLGILPSGLPTGSLRLTDPPGTHLSNELSSAATAIVQNPLERDNTGLDITPTEPTRNMSDPAALQQELRRHGSAKPRV